MKRLSIAAIALVVAGCGTTEVKPDPLIGSFQVQVTGVYISGTNRTPADVVTACTAQYGGVQANVPADVRGTAACPYAITAQTLDVDVTVTALGEDGKPLTNLPQRPVSFRVVPGDLVGSYANRWTTLTNGVGSGTIQVTHVDGEVRIWADDAPPQLDYADGGVAGDLSQLPQEPTDLSYASGVSPVVQFEAPTIAKIQIPDDGTNKSSPFVNQFVQIGQATVGAQMPVQNCDPSDPNNGQPMTMVVTGIDSQGYYLTDITACRQPEPAVKFEVPEPDGYLPGTYASIYVYNSSYPDGLTIGDTLWSVAGSIQEFTSDTQLDFDSFSVKDDVSLYPLAQQDQFLKQVPIVPLQLRTCGLGSSAYYQDALCAYSNYDLKIESLESALVKLTNVKVPTGFDNCDYNGDGTVPFFCGYQNAWTDCGGDPGSPNDVAERQCLIDCTMGQGKWAGQLCSEQSSLDNFGQFSVEMNGPGPAAAHLDDSLPSRYNTFTLTTVSKMDQDTYAAGDEVRVYCDGPVHYAFGPSPVTATTADPVLAAKTTLDHVFAGDEARVAFLSETGGATCNVGLNTHTRILVEMRDAVPDLKIDCNPNDADPDAAEQCRDLQGATYDIVGHLVQVQPARPRWEVIPRDSNDICCRPGSGLQCPRQIQQCTD